MKSIVIIPARYGSTRFPGKPLVKIDGKYMIQRVYEQAAKVVDDVWVATDDIRVESVVKKFHGNCVMTSQEHKSGTDRLAEAIQIIPKGMLFDVVVNVQGDEPFVQGEQIRQLVDVFETFKDTQIATLIKPIVQADEIFNANKPKVVTDVKGRALYFSRSPIPFIRDVEKQDWHTKYQFFKHIGIYAYTPQALLEITKLPQSKLEIMESLEQLRWVENNYSIMTSITHHESPAIDTPEDLERVLQLIKQKKAE